MKTIVLLIFLLLFVRAVLHLIFLSDEKESTRECTCKDGDLYCESCRKKIEEDNPYQ